MYADAFVRRYYTAVDEGDWDALDGLLAPSFTHYRPDRRIDGREAFLTFMREDRPQSDTVHGVDAVLTPSATPETDVDDAAVFIAAHGRLFDADGEVLVRFVDLFRVDDAGRVAELRTFTR